MPNLLLRVGFGLYDSVLYRVLRHDGVICKLQVAGTESSARLTAGIVASRALISGCKKFVAFMLLIVPKYVVGVTTSIYGRVLILKLFGSIVDARASGVRVGGSRP
jgi:hypothetical protein